MVMTDRYRDGDSSNNPSATPNSDPRGDWYGGDLEGLRLSIAEGKLDALGVRAIWLTPLQTNPTDAFMAADGVTHVTGYHGYWPVKAREVDPRLGGADALRALVAEAHAHGIRILQDFVVNHVHSEHEYVTAHPDWFRTGCVCGTANCGWTDHALDCMFRTYMPDIDHTVPEANQRFVDDAVWWVDEFDLDGLRIDAVKHVEEIATRNLAADVRETFEPGGTRYFMMGETAMGWQDCADPCNDDNYGTIAKYVGPHGLDGQFDFVLYHGVSYRTFAYGDEGMLHADYWFQHGQSKWPEGAIMTPYIGSHDTPRFVSMADYRGQDQAHQRSVVNNQWSNEAQQPSDSEPYRRMRIGMSWLLALPGAPLLYYGDEYGQWGGADPNNRYGWRPEGQLNADELATVTHIRKLGKARQKLLALRRGGYQSLGATEDTLTFARSVPNGPTAVVGLTRSTVNEPVTVDLSGLGVSGGTVLHDELGGPNVTVTGGGTATFTVPAGGAVILAP
jgi:glycosidase